ncbi:MAG: thiamine diphosphokinase, partial [Chloroflexi bacterium]|nr:thiamine diphosphokinase [Chloroflexota bacterium]
LDQTLANILLLTHPALAGRHVQLVTHRERAWMVNDHAVIVGNEGDTVSLIPLGGDVTIRNTTGLAWPLQNEQLSFGLARGVSNVMTGSQAEVDVVAGHLLCIHTFEK